MKNSPLRKFKKLSKTKTEKLVGQLKNLMFQKSTTIIYKGHIPACSFILIEGKATVSNTRSQREIVEGECVAIEAFLSSEPIGYEVKVSPGAKLLLLDKSSYREHISDIEEGLESVDLALLTG